MNCASVESNFECIAKIFKMDLFADSISHFDHGGGASIDFKCNPHMFSDSSESKDKVLFI